jgi:hypothetical protein
VEAPPQQRLSWVDALVVEAPSFARPLRSRIPHRMAAGPQTRATLPFALMATSVGHGRLLLRARAVVCRAGTREGACRPVTGEATLDVRVGATESGKFGPGALALVSRMYEPTRAIALHHAR